VLSGALASAAAVAVALALGISNGMLDPRALALVTAAAVATLAARRLLPAAPVPGASRWPGGLLAAGLVASLLNDALFLPGLTVNPALLGPFRPLLAAVAALLATYLWRGAPGWLVRARFPVLVLLAAGLGATVIQAAPSPPIDVFDFQQRGASALLAGRDPYAILYPNPYGPGTPLIPPELLTPDGRFVTSNPYLPLVLLADAPGAALGDVRWSMLAAVSAAAFLVRRLGRGSSVAELAGALVLLQPQAFTVLELSWTEPIALSAILLAWLAAERAAGRPAASPLAPRAWLEPGLAGALAASSKQYVPLLLFPLLFVLPARLRVRVAAASALGAVALLAPFAAWEPVGFFRGVVVFLVRQPFREDSLAWPAAIVAWGGPRLPSWLAYAAAGLLLLATVRRSLTPAQAMLASAATWLCLLLFSRAAHCNYYWLSVGMLCAAAALLSRPWRPPGGAQPAGDDGPLGAPAPPGAARS
jgi:hypothetical protein